MNTTTTIPFPVSTYYDRNLLERALPNLLHLQFGQVRDLPRNNTRTITFRRYGSLTAATTALAEGVTPVGSNLTTTNVVAVVSQYGDYVIVTDVVNYAEPDAVLSEAGVILGEQAGDSLDQIVRDIINAGTNVQYSDASSPKTNALRANVVATDIFDKIDMDVAIKTMKNNKVKKLTQMVNASNGFMTYPIKPCYVAIIHPNIAYQLKNAAVFATAFAAVFVSVEKYAGQTKTFTGEVGAYDEVRFVESTNSKIFTGLGGGAIDVYSTLILGANAYGVTRISGEAMTNVIKPLGSGGTSDPLNQRATSGWKATCTAAILNQSFLLRLESAMV